jgi:hypothetical protein
MRVIRNLNKTSKLIFNNLTILDNHLNNHLLNNPNRQLNLRILMEILEFNHLFV